MPSPDGKPAPRALPRAGGRLQGREETIYCCSCDTELNMEENSLLRFPAQTYGTPRTLGKASELRVPKTTNHPSAGSALKEWRSSSTPWSWMGAGGGCREACGNFVFSLCGFACFHPFRPDWAISRQLAISRNS